MLCYLIIFILVGSVTSFYKRFGIVRKLCLLNSCSIDSDEDNNDKSNQKVDYDGESLDRLFSRVEDIGIDKIASRYWQIENSSINAGTFVEYMLIIYYL